MPNIDPSWMPHCAMQRVICHWTAGAHRASDLDREHYHILIEADGRLVRGARSIADNVSTDDGVYAAHTLGRNTGSIGVAVCSMAGALDAFRPGAFPMTQLQWEKMAVVVAELCRFYRIPVTPTTVLGHGEVEANIGPKQRGKWDPLALPWRPSLSKLEVGTMFRTLVQQALDGEAPEETSRFADVRLNGTKVGQARIENGEALVAVDAVAALLKWKAKRDGDEVKFTGKGSPAGVLPAVDIDGEPHVDAALLAGLMGKPVRWDEGKRTIFVG